MKKCPECRIDVGGDHNTCPLCGTALLGEAEEPNWPKPERIRKRLIVYKRQMLFIFLAVLVLAIKSFMDGDVSTGILQFVWFTAIEGIAAMIIKLRSHPGTIVFFGSIIIISLLLLTAAWHPEAVKAVPVITICLILLYFILSLTDKSGRSLFYFIMSGVVFAATWITAAALYDYGGKVWMVCLLIALVTFIILLFINGRRMVIELRKKMNY